MFRRLGKTPKGADAGATSQDGVTADTVGLTASVAGEGGGGVPTTMNPMLQPTSPLSPGLAPAPPLEEPEPPDSAALTVTAPTTDPTVYPNELLR
jgi:hypothetical protein